MKAKFVNFLKNNFLILLYILFAIIMELSCICFIGCKPFLTKPWYPIALLAFIVAFICIFKNIHFKYVLMTLLLIVQGVMQVGFIYLYDSNGTFFEWSMFSQRNDGFGTIEDLSLRGGAIAVICVLVALYILAIVLYMKLIHKKVSGGGYKLCLKSRFAFISLSFLLAVVIFLSPTLSAISASKLSYSDRFLYGSGENRYQQVGISSNTVYEFFNGTIKNSLVKYNDNGVDEYLSNNGEEKLATSDYYGISKGNNLLYILVESFEWYPFLSKCTEQQSQILYPNLNKILKNSVYADNFYSREKTDTAEVLSMLGSNPTDVYVNYSFENNSYPYSLPNIWRHYTEENGLSIKQVKSFHQNTGSFYNRNALHKSLGFDDLVDINDMKPFGVENNWDEGEFKGERTLDSVTVSKMLEEMLPLTEEDERFFTFWITFSMHGYYVHRNNLEKAGYYDLMDEVGAFPEGNKKQNYLRTYAATVMDFDKALGLLLDRLESNGQLDNTTIVVFADHNTYYNNLSYYAKGIDERFNSELYRVPFMIYDQKLKTAYEKNEGSNVISKFTTTSDMLPTILDLFGMPGYQNLYLGSSMFIKDKESIIYSRAYRIFVTNKLICYSVNNLLYTCEGFTNEDKDDFIRRAKIHLGKLEYIDKIYHTNYFNKHKYVYL